MAKKYSIRFWIIFWVVSAILLSGWYMFLQVKDEGFKGVNVLPVSDELKNDIETLLSFGEYFLAEDGGTRTFLVLFQNNWELRPGGGFIGSFGILKIKNGNIESLVVHDTSNFDGRIPSTIEPPYPMKSMLHIQSWKFRDSNYSPDFPTNVQQAEFFYNLGGGQEQFDGVIGITTNVLLSLLEVTGPIELEGYPGVYDAKTAISTLEHQVEQGYKDQEIQKGDRKDVMNDLARAVLDKLQPLDLGKKIKLAKVGLKELGSKDVQLYFEDEELQQIVLKQGWGGQVDQLWQNDFLMIVDANLGAYKSDPHVKRSVSYTADLSQENPLIELSITYDHTASEKSWLINDYMSYTRVYVPEGSWLESYEGVEDVRFGDEFGKKYFGFIVHAKIQDQNTVTLRYTLPEDIVSRWHDLKIQKQAGLNNVPYVIKLQQQDGTVKELQFHLNQDVILSDFEE
jgi:hypothetical protein